MLNQVVLVGRVVYEIEVQKNDSGKKYAMLTLAVPRSFKNMEGTYDTIAENTGLYCHKGDIVGVKGRLQSRNIEKNKKKETIMEVIAEKVTFLTSKGQDSTDKKEEKGKADIPPLPSAGRCNEAPRRCQGEWRWSEISDPAQRRQRKVQFHRLACPSVDWA